MEDFEKAQVVLAKYRKFYPKSLNESLTTHVSAAPYHPAVIPYHIDDKILRKMNAADYCWNINQTIHQVKCCSEIIPFGSILHNKFCVMHHITNKRQWNTMQVSKRTFYRYLDKAYRLFASIIPEKILNHLYRMAVK